MNRIVPLLYLLVFTVFQTRGGNAGQQGLFPVQNLLYLEDRENTFTIQQISSEMSGKFRPVPENLHFGVTSSTYWLRFSLPGKPAKISSWIMELDNPTLESATLYSPVSSGVFKETKGGAGLVFSERQSRFRNITFMLQPGEKEETYFLALKSQFPMQVPLKLYEEQSYQAKESSVFLFFMLYVAVIAFTIVINLFYYFFLKDSLYLLYCGHAFVMISGVALVSGFAFKYVWPEGPLFNLYVSPILVFLSVYFVHGFSRRLLFSAGYTPKLDKIAYIIQIAALCLLILPVFRLLDIHILNDICAILNIVSISSMLSIAVSAWRKGYKPAIVYLVGFTGLAGGTMYYYLGIFNIADNPIGFFCISVGSTWEMVFFMAGMGLRYQLLENASVVLPENEKPKETYKDLLEKSNLDVNKKILVPGHIQKLSEREKEVLSLIAKGHTDKEIAEILCISVTTVKTHARKIYGKLLVSNRTEAVSIANTYELI